MAMDLLYEFINSTIIYFELIALFIALVVTNKTRQLNHILVCVYLIVTFVTELAGRIPTDNNVWIYNIYETTVVILLCVFYFINIRSKTARWGVAVLSLICATLWINEFTSNNWSISLFFATTFGFTSLVIGLLAVFYIANIALKGQKGHSQFVFWVSIGFIIYYLCNLPYTVLANSLDKIEGGRVLRFIQPVSSIIMYSLISLGYLWKRRISLYT